MRKEEAYPYNGSDATAHCSGGECPHIPGPAFIAMRQPHKTKDIGEGGIDPEVHGMTSANNMVSPISNWRPDAAYDPNGSADKGWGDGEPEFPVDPAFLAKGRRRFKKDVGRDEIRPDVYTVVWNMVDPAALPRKEHAPLVFEHPWEEVEHNLKMREIAALNYIDRE